MSDFEKLLAAVTAAPANTNFGTLTKLMEGAGFEMRMGKKQHAIFINPAHGKLINVAKPHHGPVKPHMCASVLKRSRKFSPRRGNESEGSTAVSQAQVSNESGLRSGVGCVDSEVS